MIYITKSGLKKASSLDYGGTLEHDGAYYIVTHLDRLEVGGRVVTINLETGYTRSFDNDILVRPVELKLIEEEM